MANSSSHLGAAAIKVLARQAAIRAVKCELQRRGIAHVPMRDIHICADEYLRRHPELIPQTMQRVWHWQIKAERERLEAALFDRSGLVCETDNAKAGTDIAGVLNTTSTIFRGWRLLITY